VSTGEAFRCKRALTGLSVSVASTPAAPVDKTAWHVYEQGVWHDVTQAGGRMRRHGAENPARTGTCVWPLWCPIRVSTFLLTLAPRLLACLILGSPPQSAASPQTSGAAFSPPIADPRPAAPTSPLVQPTASTLKITSVTSQVHAGTNATVVAQTAPGVDCQIRVTYRSGRSRAKGLVRKTADGSGQISWTWRVGTKATHGDWPMDITSEPDGESQSLRSYITVQ
jgi:hypothetical protein